MSEDELLSHAISTGDISAFSALVRMYQGRVRGFLLRMTRGDHALADDLAQETFLEAWRKIGQFRNDGPFSGWLFRIAWSRFLMTARKRKLEPLDETMEIASATETDSDTKLTLEAAMAKLAPAERAALTLCGALGYSNAEAAGILSMPVGTVKSHVSRGRERLHKLFYGTEANT